MKTLYFLFFLLLFTFSSHSDICGQPANKWSRKKLSCVNSKTNFIPVSAHLFDEENGWVVGTDGDLSGKAVKMRIKKGGKCTIDTASLTSQYSDIFFITNQKGWIVGGENVVRNTTGGLLLETSDGGATWQDKNLHKYLQNSNFKASDFTSVYFQDFKKAYILGVVRDHEDKLRGIILNSNNGGENWNLNHLGDEDVFFEDIKFSDARTGWVTTNKEYVLKTIDGANTWQIKNTNYDYNLSKLAVLSERELWATSQSSRLLYSRNGGETWEPITVDASLESKDYPVWFTPIIFTDRSNGWIGGSDGLILRTADAGKTWTTESSGKAEYIYDLLFSEKIGLAVGKPSMLFQRKIKSNQP